MKTTMRFTMFITALLAGPLLVPGSALAQAEPVGHRVEVNGMEMYYEVSGEGDPLVVEPFLEGETPKGMFDDPPQGGAS